MSSINCSKEAIVFKDGTVQLLNTSWDIEKQMRSKDKNNMEYVSVRLETDDVFSPVKSWGMSTSSSIPIWFDPVEAETALKSCVKKWANKHVYENKRFPINVGNDRDVIYVRNCRTVNLRGYKSHVVAAGRTTVNVKRAETSVSLLDKEVKLNEYNIPNTTNVYTHYPFTINEQIITDSERSEMSNYEPCTGEQYDPDEHSITSSSQDVQHSSENKSEPETYVSDNKEKIVGIVSWTGNQYEVFTNSADYIACIKDEIAYWSTSGFKFNTLTNDPAICKAVDDIAYDLYGDDNPHDVEYYKLKALSSSSEELILKSELMNEYKAFILSVQSEEFYEEDELGE